MEGKAPGVTQWRNHHAKSIIASPAGLQAMTQWANRWSAGRMPESAAEVWRCVLGVPLCKEQTGVRPLLLGEVLLKDPSVVIHTKMSQKAVSALGARQYGMGNQNAAVPTWARNCSDSDVIVSTDVQNAFGEAKRRDALVEIVASMPEAAPFLASMWGLGGTTVYLRGSDGWDSFLIMDGFFQGETWSSLLFCLVLGAVLTTFRKKLASSGM